MGSGRFEIIVRSHRASSASTHCNASSWVIASHLATQSINGIVRDVNVYTLTTVALWHEKGICRCGSGARGHELVSLRASARHAAGLLRLGIGTYV